MAWYDRQEEERQKNVAKQHAKALLGRIAMARSGPAAFGGGAASAAAAGGGGAAPVAEAGIVAPPDSK